jgi:anti-sigma regulatory factor (Ser/Thr protein kinase)
MTRLWVRHDPHSAALVRHSVHEAMTSSGADLDDAYEMALIASELIGNAIRHAPPLPSGHIAVEWTFVDGVVTIAVTDGGTRGKVGIHDAHPDEVCGRGLAIVAATADAWGVRYGRASTTIWASRPIIRSAVPADGRDELVATG